MKKNKKHYIYILFALVLFIVTGCVGTKPQTPTPPSGIYKRFDKLDKDEAWQPKRSLITSSGTKFISNINVSLLRIDPSDNNAIYMGTENNGLFYSYNGADIWQQPYQVNTGKINDIAIDPKNKCIIYVAFSNQLLKSSDCNRSYNSVYVDPRPKITVTSVVVNSINPDIVYISTDFGEIIKSINGANHWTTIQRFNKMIMKLIINPRNPLILYALVPGTGIYKTDDGGSVWKSINFDIKKYPNSLVSPKLYINFAQSDGLFLTSRFGILKTDDGGSTWKAINLTTQPSGVDILSFASNPQNDREIYYGTASTIYKTKNGGDSWMVRKLPTTAQSSFLIVDPINQSIIYLGTKNIIPKK